VVVWSGLVWSGSLGVAWVEYPKGRIALGDKKTLDRACEFIVHFSRSTKFLPFRTVVEAVEELLAFVATTDCRRSQHVLVPVVREQ
jgi:hypothetical protein